MKTSDFFIYTIGFTAQLLFSWRMIDQWMSSERSKKTEVPRQFWTHSLMASVLLFTYGWLRHDFAIVFGQILTYYIYIRNIQIQGYWNKIPVILRWLLPFFPVIVFYYTFNNNVIDIDRFFRNDKIPVWLIILGVCGQTIFILRFVYQWLYSEKKKKSLLPIGFWWCSLTGCVLILLYAVIRKDPVLIVGQLSGFVVYLRNIMIIRKSRFI
jgi:lipid-A-disaccharide synthase-like uncharacterized protein